MTFHQAKGLRPIRRSTLNRISALGVALMLACAPALAAAPAEKPASTAVAPQATAPASLSVQRIDFKRGDDGSGRLIVQFDGQGAIPDLRTQDNSVVVDVGNARLPANLQKPLNVTDFATPVQRIDAKPSGAGTQLVLSTGGAVESLAYQSGNEYVVEISARKAPAAVGAVTAGSVTQAAKGVPQRGYSGKPVTFNFQDVPVRTVLQLIAEESNLNVVASDSVQGNVTLRLVNVPWDQALDIVLRAKGMDKRQDGSVIWVAPQAELAKFEQEKEDARIAIENREDLVTDYVQINYHSASQIFKALTEAKGIGGGSGGGGSGGNGSASQEESGFLSARGRIVADERTNTLMISDIPKKIARMRELINVIDRPVDQVLIESRIVIATDTFARELGAKFGISGSRDNVYFGGNLASTAATRQSQVDTANTNANAVREWIAGGSVGPAPIPISPTISRGLNWELPVASTSNPGSLALSILNAGYLLDVELSAMQEESRGEVISNPRVVTTNQREALIKQGKEIGYVTISGGGAGGGAQTPNVQFKEVVLELKVTPTITDDNRVFLNMAVKKDEVQRYITLAGYGEIPEINRREVNTAVLVEDGQTVVIGGVYEFTDRSSVSKVPFLGDVPFLGNLFKKRGRNKDKAELLVFVTPKVLRVAKKS
ncbi:type IV pilus secretin PilQ [Stenotrophomonas sp. ESTM1D_MKCIP4_1]|uniref:type IV pilus secretin PilQ n=1 Tax=Stenotrophomonas sp. ESTM1D_MKCIP4_1 TaxID=2072414 RepID=UPI000D53CFD9|nr:type IV pilus secretin PilQ family protein [Stenotrophomonas sp. ESTM1D_MKCIP4_1]AWH54557.1 type IV pilus secretin PilQ [Stenotrophomonas sp. ESTM1D_MKCIP4_1]